MLPAFKDWRTTVPALVSGICGFVAATGNSYHWPQWLVMLSALAAFGGLSALGINARSQGQHDADAKEMASAVQQDISRATGVKTYAAVDAAAEQADPAPQSPATPPVAEPTGNPPQA